MKELARMEYLKACLISLGVGAVLSARLHLPEVVALGVVVSFILSVLWQKGGNGMERRRDASTMELPELLASCRGVMGKIRQMNSDPAFPRSRREGAERAVRIERALQKLMRVIEEDEDKHEAARLFYPGYLLPISDELERYYRLSTRGIKSAEPQLRRADEELDLVEDRLNQLFEKLHEADILTLGSMNEMLGVFMRPESFSMPEK